MKLILPSLCLILSSAALVAAETLQPTRLTRLDDRVRVEIGGQLFTEYIFKGSSRPYCYPLLASDGTSLVRDYPMKETPGEDIDHKHHRALMFAHSNVNEVDFWNEGTSGTKFPKGNTVHDGIVELKSGDVGSLKVRNRWEAPDGKLIATDETTIRFRGVADARFLDYEVTIKALPDAPLVMGDNKDGTMAVRIAQWMNAPRKVKGVEVGTGTIVTANGERNGAAWGTRAPWCDYHATRNGRVYGIAIFDHPQNLRHPTWWMAREYGLFAANPFGQKDFEPAAKHAAGKGNYTIPAGGSLTLRYRFYLHSGDEKAANVGERYKDYAAGR